MCDKVSEKKHARTYPKSIKRRRRVSEAREVE